MALRKGFPAKLSGVGADADDMRYNLAGQVVRSSAGVPRSGLFPPVSATLLSSTATMNIAVAAFSGVAVRDGGVVFLANDGPTNVLLSNPPASNARLDVLYAKQNDASSTVTAPDGNNTPLIGVLTGVASASPVRNPAGLPVGALELGTVLVPSTAVNTGSSGVVIAPTFQYTAMNGGAVAFRTKAELDLWTTATPNQHAFVIADGIEYAWSSAWVQVPNEGAWATATLAGSWATFSSPFRSRLVGSDVELTGSVKGGSGTITTLPVGSRPTGTLYFNTLANAGVAQISVAPTGVVALLGFVAGGSNVIVSLDSIRFPVN